MSEHDEQVFSFTISLKLDCLNEYTASNRRSKYAGNKSKQVSTNICFIAANNALRAWKKKPCKTDLYDFKIIWKTPTGHDSDNMYFGVKFILDGMVEAGVIKDDKRAHVRHIANEIYTSKVYSVTVNFWKVKEGK